MLCGIDVGSLRTPSYVAWLREGAFALDLYIPTERQPLPRPPAGWHAADCLALDAPQGLPTPGERRRHADREADTPTRALPSSRRELEGWKLYKGLVEAGVDIFWWVHEQDLGCVAGFSPVRGHPPAVCETYPRFVLRRLGVARADIPSKTGDPLGYIDTVWGLIQGLGYRCPAVLRPSVDQADAMLCALAAEAWHNSTDPRRRAVGAPPIADVVERVIYEGFIVAP